MYIGKEGRERMKLHRRLCQSREGASRAHARSRPLRRLRQSTRYVFKIEPFFIEYHLSWLLSSVTFHRVAPNLKGTFWGPTLNSHAKVQITCAEAVGDSGEGGRAEQIRHGHGRPLAYLYARAANSGIVFARIKPELAISAGRPGPPSLPPSSLPPASSP